MAIALSSTKELLSRLVEFDTTSAKSNLPIIEFIRSYLESYGVGCELVMNDEGTKASLFATLGEGTGGIGLSGHTDVVPVTGQSWDSDPFTVVEKDDALYGRGTADMKGYLACMLAMVPNCLERTLHKPIHLLFSYDEEVGCTGVRPLISQLGTALPCPSVTIVGEPTNMTVVDGHKSIRVFKTKITGKEVHSSEPDLGVNAIFVGTAFINELKRLSHEVSLVGENARYYPPRSTIHVGTIRGGTALNIVPKICEFFWEIRGLPGADVDKIVRQVERFVDEELLPPMKAVSPDADIETRQTLHVPEFAANPSSDAVSMALKLAEQNETYAVSYGTEAGLFEGHGIPTVVCGPGSIGQAHQPNEFIKIEELSKCLVFLERLMDSLDS